jgi:chemotaxis protein methyltransferase CheR
VFAPNLNSAVLQGFSSADYEAFAAKIQRKLGIRLGEYKVDQMQRRLGTVAKQHGATSFVGYFAAIERDNAILNEFLDQMTINVTELMRNPALFEDLAKTILPGLIEAKKGLPLNIWSAGCSYGAEACTVAMLLREMVPPPQYRIKATDLDLAVLAKANSVNFTKADMVSVSPERRKKNFIEIDDNTFMPLPDIRRSISFSQQDLLSDDYPPNTYDLILCRNVVIYFNDEAKERIFRNFWKALRPGGVLFVGGTERLGDTKTLHFELIKPFFYRATNK